MRIYALLPTVLATSAMLSSLAAQEPRIMRVGPGTILRPGQSVDLSWEPDHTFGLDASQDAHAGEEREDEPVPAGAAS